MLIDGRRSVHSFLMGFELDVHTFLDADLKVIRTICDCAAIG